MTDPTAVIRYAGGQVDDVAITGDLFRMEQMDRDHWWVCIYRGDKRTMFGLWWDKRRREIVAHLTEDTIGCHDDSLEVGYGREYRTTHYACARTRARIAAFPLERLLRQSIEDGFSSHALGCPAPFGLSCKCGYVEWRREVDKVLEGKQ